MFIEGTTFRRLGARRNIKQNNIIAYTAERQDRTEGISKRMTIDVNFSRKAGATFAWQSPQLPIGINRLMVLLLRAGTWKLTRVLLVLPAVSSRLLLSLDT